MPETFAVEIVSGFMWGCCAAQVQGCHSHSSHPPGVAPPSSEGSGGSTLPSDTDLALEMSVAWLSSAFKKALEPGNVALVIQTPIRKAVLEVGSQEPAGGW